MALLGFYLLTLLAVGLGNPALADDRLSQAPTSSAVGVQCNDLVSVANRATDTVQRISADPDIDSLSGLMAIVTIADQAIADMQALSLSDTTVLSFRDRFVAMYAGTREAGQALIDAANQSDQTAAEQAFSDLQAATSVEDSLVSEVNTYCGYTATPAESSGASARLP